jgi:cell wall-associated NlpC family hydrolase
LHSAVGSLSTESSADGSFEKRPADDSGQQSAGEEDLADVTVTEELVYETSCQLRVKEYEMGKHLGRSNIKTVENTYKNVLYVFDLYFYSVILAANPRQESAGAKYL